MNPEDIRDKLQAGLGGGGIELSQGPVDPAITVPLDRWHEAAQLLCRDHHLDFTFLRSLSAVDRPQIGRIEVVAHLLSYQKRHGIVVKTQVDRASPAIASVSDVWPAAEWYERELYDMFGVSVLGHRDLRRLLMPDDWVGFPLRKDYQEPASYHGIPMRRPT